MKNIILSTLVVAAVVPTLAIADVCTPYTQAYTLALDNGDATGSLTKSQTCQGNANTGQYAINSQMNIQKGWFSKTINQAASGTYASPNSIVSRTYTSSNNNTPFPTTGNIIDTLSLPLYLASSLNTGIMTFPSLNVFYNGNTINLQCSVSNANTTITTGANQTISAISISCASADNSLNLSYTFTQDKAALMLTANVVEQGKQTFLATINKV